MEKELLKFIRTVSLPAVGRFAAAQYFREGATVDGIVVAWLGDDFKQDFLPKVEEAVPALDAREYELVESAYDPTIIVELGGEKLAETSLGQLLEFFKTVDRRRGYVRYIRYIRDVHGVLWAVRADWGSDELDVEAYPLNNPPDRWHAGLRFLSREAL